jgi:hypothetical protein
VVKKRKNPCPFSEDKLNVTIGKGKFVLCLTEHHAMKTYVELDEKLHAFLTSVLDGSKQPASRPGGSTP